MVFITDHGNKISRLKDFLSLYYALHNVNRKYNFSCTSLCF